MTKPLVGDEILATLQAIIDDERANNPDFEEVDYDAPFECTYGCC